MRNACHFVALTLLVASIAIGKPAPGTPPVSDTGILSETEFKKLHELRTDAVPPLHGTMIEVGGARAYLSLPEKVSPGGAGVVVIQEWWGLNDNIEHWTDRFAAAGYAAIAPDLYGGRVATSADSAMAYMKAVDAQRAVAILKAAHHYLATDARIRATRTGSVGWCFGGGMSLQLALNEPDLDACVMYYGRPVTDVSELKKLRAPLLGIFGSRDQAFPPALVKSFEDALKQAGAKRLVLSYDADHAFANPSNPHYDEKSATQAWEQVGKFFDTFLRSEPGTGAGKH